MIGDIYLKQTAKREELIRELFEKIASETIGVENIKKVSFILLYHNHYGCNWCEAYEDKNKLHIKIGIELPAIRKRTKIGYEEVYYSGRKLKVDKYILHNRHNAIRFALYHELKHAKDMIRNSEKVSSEFYADEWAIKHLEGVK